MFFWGGRVLRLKEEEEEEEEDYPMIKMMMKMMIMVIIIINIIIIIIVNILQSSLNRSESLTRNTMRTGGWAAYQSQTLYSQLHLAYSTLSRLNVFFVVTENSSDNTNSDIVNPHLNKLLFTNPCLSSVIRRMLQK